MRGTRLAGFVGHSSPRIIPAHAGNTILVHVDIHSWWDHPRACGEHLSMMTITCSQRIIPAHAGNTAAPYKAVGDLRDHPRACGEHPYFRGVTLGSGGSSPRMRGTPIGIAPRVSPDGIIPAHAGNTQPAGSWSDCCRDHPRACGEHQVRDTLYGTTQGSSPRMRGTPRVRGVACVRIGIIPAHAGNTVVGT